MKKIQRNVIVLGWVSFLTDTASEMILPVLPLFLDHVLGTGKALIGLIEGVGESVASVLKVGSGWYSDRIGRRKPLVVLGYSLSNLVKPLLCLTNTWGQVLGVRSLDRVGKGIRTSPRDVLIAQASVKSSRGKSFGFHRMMDTSGAIVGTILAFTILSLMPGAYRTIFALSAIPGIIAILVLLFMVTERRQGTVIRRENEQTGIAGDSRLGKNFRWFLIVISVFSFSHISYAFYILRANELGISDRLIPIVYLFYNLIYALLSLPVGSLSDRLGRTRVLGGGFFANALLLLGFAYASRPVHAWFLFGFYGLLSAIIETIPRALVSDIVASTRRGTGLGWYHTTVGLVPLPSNLLFGYLWGIYGAHAIFSVWAGISAIAFVLLLLSGRLIAEDKSSSPEMQRS